MLGDCQAIARLAVGWIMGTKTFCVGWIDVGHKDSDNVEGIFFEIIEQTDCVQKGAILDLSTKLDGNTFLVKVALPDVVQNCLGFHGVTRDEDREQLLMNSIGCKLDDEGLEVTVDYRTIGPARSEVECQFK